MQILYKPVLTMQLWHDYLLGQPAMPTLLPADYDVSSVLSLVPTADCLRRLRNLRWVPRPTPQGLMVFAEVTAIAPPPSPPTYATKIPVDRPTRLTFWLEARDRTFANFTNLPLTADRHRVYYFSNRSGNLQTYTGENAPGDTETRDYRFLSQPLAAYSAGSEYALGQLVTGDGSTLEAVTYQSSAAATPTAAWETLPPSQYVSAQDRLPHQGVTRTHAIAAANPGETYQVSLTDIHGHRPFGQTLSVPDTHPAGDPFVIPLNFTGQPPGRYRLAINDAPVDEAFVLFDPQTAPRALGLVEIAVDATDGADPFALLQADGNDTLIQPQTYIIRFKNRTTRWRYRTQAPHGLTDAALPAGLTRLDDRTYATARPIGLLQKPNPPSLNNGRRNLPFPSAAQISPTTDIDQRITAVFSDIYL